MRSINPANSGITIYDRMDLSVMSLSPGGVGLVSHMFSGFCFDVYLRREFSAPSG